MSESADPIDEAAAAAESTRQILVFGGTFDPPHLAHTRLAQLAAQQLECDEILFVPAAINPLKSERPDAGRDHRIAMLLLATADLPGARISAIELDRPGKSYMIDTLRELTSELPQSSVSPGIHRGMRADCADQPRESGSEKPHGRAMAPREAASGQCAAIVNRQSSTVNPKLFLLIGADQAIEFHSWKDWQQILTLARPAVMLRPPWDEKSFEKKLSEVYSPLEAEHWLSWTLIRGLPMMDVNATEIRRRLKNHEDTEGLLHPAVAEYIRANRLYETADERG